MTSQLTPFTTQSTLTRAYSALDFESKNVCKGIGTQNGITVDAHCERVQGVNT